MNFTHTCEVDWLVLGIPPIGRKLRIPFTSVVNLRGDRLNHKHISWDQATVLIQLGLLPEYLLSPHRILDDKEPTLWKGFEVRVPAAGVETITKMLDKNGIKSNDMLGYKGSKVSIIR
ncbi:hypothetical protein N431DRAFT_558956 [Stipitochalara longipes BDJ]|nr:hypothetical protein N431DRAFT_558956 [Stipitochalara longipes BDJ]